MTANQSAPGPAEAPPGERPGADPSPDDPEAMTIEPEAGHWDRSRRDEPDPEGDAARALADGVGVEPLPGWDEEATP